MLYTPSLVSNNPFHPFIKTGLPLNTGKTGYCLLTFRERFASCANAQFVIRKIEIVTFVFKVHVTLKFVVSLYEVLLSVAPLFSSSPGYIWHSQGTCTFWCWWSPCYSSRHRTDRIRREGIASLIEYNKLDYFREKYFVIQEMFKNAEGVCFFFLCKF